ncbi:DUF3575 domain-containing protein [Flavobacterium agricola]|uniref:DUF3575 domain-containing protein n=1 Tax=Flavobacterium agricola TaxID=2870839 RepID=A0ABY6LZS9_9FLAO|nr:DUF3575 domain-containing protein [Flavobacterium agricola]UYW01077.1 DUF3575 domain-containing protein [Flavobacterium agricola]
MKKILTLSFLLISFLGFSQTETETNQPNVSSSVTEKNEFKPGKNMLKLNLLSLTVGNISLQYERLLTKRMVVSLSAGITPERGIPFYSAFKDALDNQDTKDQLQGLKYSNYAITPEVRFYFGKESYKGFYVGVFGRYTAYDIKFPLFYDNVLSGIPGVPGNLLPKETINLDGNIKAFSGGISLGAQWKLSKRLYLDWLVVGPHIGSSKGTLSGNKKLTALEQQKIREVIDDLDIPLLKYHAEVNENGARMRFDGPWAGARTSLAIGYRF